MKILVTGGAGFIGSYICNELVRLGHHVVIVDNFSSGLRENLSKGMIYYCLDIVEDSLQEVFEKEKPEIVIHLAAQVNVNQSINSPVDDASVNILGTLKVLENCHRFHVRKLIYSSSAAVYGNPVSPVIDETHPIKPISPYGISKYIPEYYIKYFGALYGLSYTILRYSNVYGARQSDNGEGGVISIFMNKLMKGETPVIFGDGEQERDFIYVGDVARANVLAIHEGDGVIANISTNTATSINQLMNSLQRMLGVDIEPQYAEGRPGDIQKSILNNGKAKQLLNWTPQYKLEAGLKEMLSYCQKEKV